MFQKRPVRLGQIALKLILASVLIALSAGGSYLVWDFSQSGDRDVDLMLHGVQSQDMKVVVMERGSLESGNNRDLICEIEARSPGSPATSIKWIVSEGHIAKEGDLLVEFDSASLEDSTTQQKLKLEQSRAAYTTAQADLDIQRSQNESDIKAAETTVELAEIDLEKYIKGDYVKEKRIIEGDILIAEEELKRAQERLEYTKKLQEKGFASKSDVESDKLAVTRAENNLKIAKEEIRVLEEYSKPRTIKDLTSLLEESRRALERVKSQSVAKEAQVSAAMLAKEVEYKTEESTLKKLVAQLTKCKLYAPINGMVTYANDNSRWGRSELQIEEGASIRERQKVIRIPDLRSMRVNVKVHEAKVGHLSPGQPANIRVESMPDRVLKGTIDTVATMADSQSFFSTGVQVFTVMVAISEEVEGLKPGMTAEVEILAKELQNVLAVPVQSVLERNGKSFCYVKRAGVFELIAVTLGVSNDKEVVVEEGLQEGDFVAQNITAAISDEEIKALTESTKEEQENAKKDEWAGRKTKASTKRSLAGGSASGQGGPRGQGSAAGGGGSGEDRAKRLMDRFDKDKDGKISAEEMTGMSFLERFDKNKDGEVTSEEAASAMSGSTGGGGARAPQGERSDPTGGGAGGGSGFKMPANGTEWISSMDKNSDGKVTKDELPSFMQSFFGSIDTNSDGFVDTAEADESVRKMKERMQNGGGPPQ